MAPAVLSYFLSSSFSRYLRTSSGTSWALVTGASDGIGRAFAHELASHGFNLVLHGRNPGKLSAVVDSLKTSFPTIKTRTVIVDATSFTHTDISNIAASIADLPLTVLINNVGGTGVLRANFQTFGSTTPEELDGLINVNIRFTIHLTHALLPQLTANTPALIMNIGSQAHAGVPYLSTYSGTKGFIHSFSKALAVEMQGQGEQIEVLEILVGSVQTNQNRTEKPTYFVPSARTMAQSALARVGCGEASIVAYGGHAVQAMGMNLMPSKTLNWLTVKYLKPVVGKTQREW